MKTMLVIEDQVKPVYDSTEAALKAQVQAIMSADPRWKFFSPGAVNPTFDNCVCYNEPQANWVVYIGI